MQTDFPSAVYWYTSVVISITVAVIIGIVNRVMDEKINRGKAVNILVATVVFVVISYLILFYGIGKIFLLQGEFLEKTRGCSSAISAYQVAVRWLPSSGEAQIRFARCMSAVKQFDNALRILDSLEEKENSKYTYWWARSIIYFSKGDYKALSASTESMLSLMPSTSQIVVDMAKNLHSKFYRAEAESLLRNVRVYDDGNNYAVFWLAWALFEQGKNEDALYHFDLCLQRFTQGYEAGRCHAGKGFIFVNNGRYSEAISEFTISLEILPDQEDVQKSLNQLMP